jgi:chromosomal replication initiator protein
LQDNLWQAVLGEIEVSVTHANFATWFKNTELLSYNQEEAVIGVPNIFIKQQLETKFSDLVEQVLAKNNIKSKKLVYKVHSSSKVHNRIEYDDPVVLSGQPSNQKKQSTLAHSYRRGLNEKYTFDTFIVGSGNELAYAACRAIAVNPGKKYNPFFVYGGVGIGKTHLAEAVGNEVLANNPDAKVVYISTEQFVQEFLDAIRYKKNTDFAGYYRSADVLIVDDIQFIAGKEKTQEEFFHTFNALHQANKQIIITSDKPPKDIPTLEERLRSRFAWGMSVDMQIPDFETRCAIVQTKAVAQEFELPPDVVEVLAENIKTNIRELEGALNQLVAVCEMKGVPPNVELAKSVLGAQRTRTKHISPKSVIDKTAKFFGVSIEDVMSPKRDKDIVVPRQVSMFLLRNELHLSFPRIARELGRKDHTTAIHSVDKVERVLINDLEMQSAVNEIRERIYA